MDVRARYTKNIITKTFLELLESKSIDKITVTEICHKADINRTTFYKHYMDVYDLLEKTENEALNTLDELMAGCQGKDTKMILSAVLETLKNQGSLIVSILKNNPDEAFLTRLQEHCYENIRSHTTYLQISAFPSPEKELTLNFIAYGISGAISSWLAQGMPGQPAEIAQIIEKICLRIIKP